MSTDKNHHVVSYKTYLIVLVALLILTFASVAVTSINLRAVTVTVALLFAVIKSSLVLTYFMHLKFENRMYAVMVGGVLLVFLIMIIVTFFDYNFR